MNNVNVNCFMALGASGSCGWEQPIVRESLRHSSSCSASDGFMAN